MKRLPRRREHLGTFLGSYAPPEDGQYLVQGPSGEADNNINTLRLYSAHGQTNNPASHKVETRATDRMR